MRLGGVHFQTGLGQPAVFDVVSTLRADVLAERRITTSEVAVAQAGEVGEETVEAEGGVEVEEFMGLVPNLPEGGHMTDNLHPEVILRRHLRREGLLAGVHFRERLKESVTAEAKEFVILIPVEPESAFEVFIVRLGRENARGVFDDTLRVVGVGRRGRVTVGGTSFPETKEVEDTTGVAFRIRRGDHTLVLLTEDEVVL